MKTPKTTRSRIPLLLGAMATGLALLLTARLARDVTDSRKPAALRVGLSSAATEIELVAPPAAARVTPLLPAETAAGSYRAPIGSRFGFRARSRVTARFLPDPSRQDPTESVELSVDDGQTRFWSGQIDLVIADRRAGEILARVAFEDLPGAPPKDLGEQPTFRLEFPEEPTWVRLSEDGTIQGYRFPTGLDADLRNQVRNIVAAFAFRVPVDAGEAWDGVEGDASGIFEALYERVADDDPEALRVRRTKRWYVELAGSSHEPYPHVIEGSADGVLSTELGWLRDARVAETVELELPGVPLLVTVASAGELSLVRADRVAPEDLGPLDEVWSGPWSPAAGHHEDLSDVQAASEENRWRMLLRDVQLFELVDQIRQTLAAGERNGPFELMEAVSWMVRLHSELAAEIHGLLLQRTTDAGLASTLLQALSVAGNDAAQEVLVSVLHGPDGGLALRDAAAMAMFKLQEPGDRLMADLAAGVQRLATLREWSDVDVRELLLLGTLTGRNARGVEELLAMETQAREVGQLDMWLHALGNAGLQQALAPAIAYLDHESDEVRSAAVAALRGVDSQQGSQALAERAANDPSPDIRVEAARALTEQTSHPEAREALRQLARDDPLPAVRQAVVSMLSPLAQQDSSTQAMLQQMVLEDPSPDVQSAARSILETLGLLLH